MKALHHKRPPELRHSNRLRESLRNGDSNAGELAPQQFQTEEEVAAPGEFTDGT